MAIPASMPPQNAWPLRFGGSGGLVAGGLGAGCPPDAAGGSCPPCEGCCSFMAQSCHPEAARSELVTDPGAELARPAALRGGVKVQVVTLYDPLRRVKVHPAALLPERDNQRDQSPAACGCHARREPGLVPGCLRLPGLPPRKS
jgi:hypothetical protein